MHPFLDLILLLPLLNLKNKLLRNTQFRDLTELTAIFVLMSTHDVTLFSKNLQSLLLLEALYGTSGRTD